MKDNKRHIIQTAKASAREQRVQALREGRKERGGFIPDKRKALDKKACRKGQW